MADPIISISGLRGIVGSELTPNIAVRFASALCCSLEKGPIVLARDGRVSGPMLVDAIASAIVAHGRDCLDLDVASTPTAGLNVRHLLAAGGIQVSASHNPPPYNGMKLFGPDGRVLSAGPGRKVLDSYNANATHWVGVDSLGKRIRVSNPHEIHGNAVLATVDVSMIRKAKFKVLLDANHGAGGILGAVLLRELGCEVTVLGEVATGLFDHPPEPIAENLSSVCSIVAQGPFDIGFCQDPDADRLAVIDANGNFIGEEFTAVLCSLGRLSKEKGPLVTNCASSNLTRWLAEKHNVPFIQTAVGEANVADGILANNAIYGGEGSGGPIDPKVGLIRDSFVGMAQILELMAKSKKTVEQIVASFPPMSMIKDKMTMSKDVLMESLKVLEKGMGAKTISQLDGVRLDWDDQWILLRASNTEPIVRLIAEAPTAEMASGLIKKAKGLLGL